MGAASDYAKNAERGAKEPDCRWHRDNSRQLALQDLSANNVGVRAAICRSHQVRELFTANP